MNLEPLSKILKLYKNKNKVFETFFLEETLKKIKNKYFYDENQNELYLNDNITLVKKNTGKFYKSGKIIAINQKKITIKTNNNYITIDSNEYYIFIKYTKKKNKEFYKALLDIL